MHEHIPNGRDDYVRPDGIREVWWQCMCGLEEKRFFQDGECIAVRYRYMGRWIEAAELLMLVVPMKLCQTCSGLPELTDTCIDCHGIGVVELTGEKVVEPPAPRATRVVP